LLPVPRHHLLTKGRTSHGSTHTINTVRNLPTARGEHYDPRTAGKHNIKGYFRYVDDILLVYIDNTTNIHNVLDEFNNPTPKLKFTLEEEQNNRISFLDITIKKEP